MAEQPVSKILTDPDIKAYQDYMPDDWGEMTIGPLPEGTVLERLVLDLGLSWRSALYTAQMPATSIKVMHAAAVGAVSSYRQIRVSLRIPMRSLLSFLGRCLNWSRTARFGPAFRRSL